uniref:Ribonuclease E n=1 Tax=Paulinella micropora TaxID=1928728 RepID=A0A385I0T0_9EUKA|nr:ribonuclease E [Paulinella micropora]AXY63475.1 ribonuclease E [Paulinella micropora]
MPQQIIIAEQLRIAAVLKEERVDELIVAQGSYQIGDIYLGTVENVLPGIDAAFINIGESEKNGFIHISDLGPLKLKKTSSGITELLEPQQKVLVQVIKEPTGTKGPRLTGNLTLPGRYLVLQPYSRGVNISRRIRAENERNRLRALGVLIKPPGASLLIRTEAEEVNEELLIDDLETLLRQWEEIQQAAETANPPALLNRDEDFIHRILRDIYSPDLLKIVVDSVEAVERVNSFLGVIDSKLQVEYYNRSVEILEYYRINSAIREALKPRVELPSGGYIIIEQMEALTVIDVNSGSFTRSANARETVLWTNCEAALEIARQLKLRNIGGVIIIDFIDMELRRDQLQLLEHFIHATRDDTARPQIAQLTELGLVELTRKRQGQNIYELFGRICSVCGGLGHVATLPGAKESLSLVNSGNTVRSNIVNRSESSFPINSTSNERRKNGRPGKTRNNIKTKDNPLILRDVAERAVISDPSNNSVFENTGHRQDQDLFVIPMEPEQELVYAWMGFSPILLLDPLPSNQNTAVWVARSGEATEKVLEDARSQLASTKARSRRQINDNYASNARIGTVSVPGAISYVNAAEVRKKTSITVQNSSSEERRSFANVSLSTKNSSLEDLPEKATPILPEVTIPAINSAYGEHHRIRRRRSSAN